MTTTTKLTKRTGFQLAEAEAIGATVNRTTCEWALEPGEVLAKIDDQLVVLVGKGRRTALHSLRRAVVALLEDEDAAASEASVLETQETIAELTGVPLAEVVEAHAAAKAEVEAIVAAAPLVGIEIGKPKIVEAVRDALARMPKGSKSKVAKDGSLVVAEGEAEAVVAALTLHMREGIKADRGGFMYTARKLRKVVRPAVIAAHPDGAKGLPQPKAKGTASAGKLARVEALNDQLAAARAAKAAAKTQPAAKRVG